MVPISYNLRSLTVRKTTTLATALGIGLVVFVFAAVMMLGAGIKKTLSTTGRADYAIIMRKGADAELSSAIDTPNVGLILAPKEVERRQNGSSNGVGEVVVVITTEKLGTEGISNVTIRGVSDDVYEFRPEAKIIEGRKAKPGSDECVIGRAVRGRFKGMELGQMVEMRKNRPLKVVGIMEAAGSSYESEVWADVDAVRSAFGREGIVQSVRAKLVSAAAFDSYKRAIEGNRQLGLSVERETVFYEKQSQGTSAFIMGLGGAIAFFFSLGAMIGAMITMYSAVASRGREIGTLRALGFGKFTIMFSFLLESVMLALIGGALGALAAMSLGFVTFSIINFQAWSEMVFRFEPTPGIVGGSLLFAGIMGLVGGFFPAVRAGWMPLVQALKD
ncbi:MAG: ABC transporter permease [Myxococcales bacterium]